MVLTQVNSNSHQQSRIYKLTPIFSYGAFIEPRHLLGQLQSYNTQPIVISRLWYLV